jgi:hypothetical protein
MAVSRSQDGFSRPNHDLANSDGRLSDSTPEVAPSSPPLLMPPPTTILADVRHRMQLSWLRMRTLIESNTESLVAIIRLGIFVIKIVTMTRPCWPYMININVGIPLMVLAGMDLGILNTGGMVVSRSPSGTGRHEFTPASRLAWDLWTSVALLALHMLALWITSKWGWTVFCAVNMRHG